MGYWNGTNGISAAWRVGPSLFVLSAIMIWKDYRASILTVDKPLTTALLRIDLD